MDEMRWESLQMCLEGLFHFAEECPQLDPSKPFPSYVPSTFIVAIASMSLEVIHLIQIEKDPDSRLVWRCFCALVAMKLAASISSRTDSNVSNDELAFLSAILGIQSDDVKFCLECPGAIELASIASLEMGDISPSELCSRTSGYVRLMANRTVHTLSEALPADKATELQAFSRIKIVDEKLVDVIASNFHDLLQSGTPLLTAAARRSRLRLCLKSLWYCAKAYHHPKAVDTLPQYSLNTLASPENIRRIQTVQDPISRVMGCCFSALIIVKLVASMSSRVNSGVEISNFKLEWLSVILGPNSDDMKISLRWPGAVELASLVYLASLADGVGSESLDINPLPSYLIDVAQETLDILSGAANLKLDQQTAPLIGLDEKFGRMVASHLCSLLKKGVPDTSSSMAEVRTSCVRMCIKILWYCAKEHHQLGASRPLPSYFPNTLAGPEMIHLFQTSGKQDAETGVMERCFGTLVATKLVADLRSRTDSESNVQISCDELACLSAILGTENRTLKIWLGRPGVVELASLFSLTLTGVDPLFNKVSDVLDDMVQQTSNILAGTLPAEFYIELVHLTDGTCEAILLCLRDRRSDSHLSETSPPTEPIYESRARVYLKNLWSCARAYKQLGISVPLPSFVRITLANPEFIRQIHTETDLAARVTGRCACALVVIKLVDDFPSRISLGDDVYNEELACISILLGTAPGEPSRWPHPSAVIKLQNVVTLVSGEIETLLFSEQTPTDTLHTVQQTLEIICSDLVFGDGFAVEDLPMDQVSLLRDCCSKIAKVRSANRFGNETAGILGQLQQILEQLPTVERKMRRCTSLVFDPRSVRGRGNLTTRPENEVRRRRSKSM